MLLAGRVDFQAAAGDYISFQYDGTNWYETTRRTAAAADVNIYNSNGSLLSTRTVTGAGFSLTFTNNTAAATVLMTNTSSGVVLNLTGTTGLALNAGVLPATTNSIADVANFNRLTTGTPAAGIGGRIVLNTEVSTGAGVENAAIEWALDDVTGGSQTGYVGFNTTLSGTPSRKMTIHGNGRVVLTGRLLKSQGADVASAAGAIAVGLDGNVFEVTGTASITLISNLNFQNGAEITLVFTSTATLTDGTANSGTDIGMELAGATNFTASADDLITLVLCEVGGTQRWREKSRSVN